MALELRFLGPPAVLVDGREASLRHRRAIVLLTLLALRGGRSVERGLLAQAIWPEREIEEAGVNLRRALADLRGIMGPEAGRLSSPDRRTLRLDARCDIVDFDEAARRFRLDARPEDARRALEAYRGSLLEGWTEECLEPERRHREEEAASLAEALARLALAEREPSEALRQLDRAETILPHRDSTLRLRLDVHLSRGDGTAARAAYGSFARRLDREIGLAPNAESSRLAERLSEAAVLDPRPLTPWPLVGRAAELDRLRREVAEGGVVTVVGPGGVGKTRLALAAVAGRPAAFVDLSRLPADASIRDVAQATDAPGDPLVLDNAEHLLPTIALAVEDAIRARRAILVTSRTPLGVPGERLVRLSPLDAPDAALLFASRAEAVRPGVARDAERIDRVCRRLEGMPLALELAAARLRSLSLADLDARLDGPNGIDLLASVAAGTPDRQRTIAGTVRWSLGLLSAPARQALGRLATFPAGFDVEAVEAVVGPDGVEALRELVDQSLVLVDDGDAPRYRILESVRDIAVERGTADAEVAALGRWAASFAARAYEGLWHGDAAHWSHRIEREWANLRVAVERGRAADAARVVEAVDAVWWRSGRFREGIAWREAARRRAQVEADAGLAARHALAAEQFRRRLGEPNRARAAFRENVDACLAANDPPTAVYLLHSLGFVERDDGELAQAGATMREALTLARGIGETGLVAYARRGVALVDLASGRSTEAVEGLQRAAADFLREALLVQETITLVDLAEALLEAGDPQGAATMAEFGSQKSREQRNATAEAVASLVGGRAMLALGNVAMAVRRLDEAEAAAEALNTPERRADLAVFRSSLARAQGSPRLRLTLGVLQTPSAPHLPYPSLLRTIEEAARTLRALGSEIACRRMEAELLAARGAADAGSWSAGLAVVRALAAFPAESIRSE